VNESRIPVKVFRGTLLLTLLSCICFVLFVRVFVDMFYPVSYAMVSTYASWLAISFSIHGIGDMLNRFLGSHGIGRPIRNSSYVCGLIKIVGFVVFVWLWNIEGAIITHVMSSCAYCLGLYYYYHKLVSKSL
jgi:O-antigen/teichoic acid export membrane protein